MPAPTVPTPSAPLVDVLCVGLVCVDLTLSIPHHPGPDEKLRASSRLVTPGGPAAVASAQIARLGGRAAFAGLLGDPTQDAFAPLLRAAFASTGVDTSALFTVLGHETPLAAILVKPDAARTVLSHRPAPHPDFVTNLVTLPRARVLLADGHRPEWTPGLLAHARDCAAPLVLDAGSWTDAVRALATFADHLVASEACARSALGTAHDPATAEPEALRVRLAARPDATVIVTLGPRGLLWSTPHAAGALPAFRIEALDTTGAGDAFHGAYALGLARGMPLAERLRFASAAGALACTRAGAWSALADSAEIAALLARLA